MALIEDAASFHDFLGLAIVYAPDFPQEDFLEPDEQLTLDYVIAELEIGLVLIPGMKGNPVRLEAARSLLKTAKEAYDRGDQLAGSDRLQELDRELFRKKRTGQETTM